MTAPPSQPHTPEGDLRPYGYAPGNYYNTCVRCHCTFIGAKHAWRCGSCAAAAAAETENK